LPHPHTPISSRTVPPTLRAASSASVLGKVAGAAGCVSASVTAALHGIVGRHLRETRCLRVQGCLYGMRCLGERVLLDGTLCLRVTSRPRSPPCFRANGPISRETTSFGVIDLRVSRWEADRSRASGTGLVFGRGQAAETREAFAGDFGSRAAYAWAAPATSASTAGRDERRSARPCSNETLPWFPFAGAIQPWPSILRGRMSRDGRLSFASFRNNQLENPPTIRLRTAPGRWPAEGRPQPAMKDMLEDESWRRGPRRRGRDPGS
jgi:hypothetical protein